MKRLLVLATIAGHAVGASDAEANRRCSLGVPIVPRPSALHSAIHLRFKTSFHFTGIGVRSPHSVHGRPDVVVQLGLPPFRLDLLTSIGGVGFEDAWPTLACPSEQHSACPSTGLAG